MRSTIVTLATIEYAWPSVEKYIKAGFDWGDGGRGDDTLENVHKALLAGHCQLWVMHNARGIRGACAAKIDTLPTGRKIYVTISHSAESLDETLLGLKELEKFAKANGCTAIRITGRRGWAVLKKHGYKEPFICLEKEL